MTVGRTSSASTLYIDKNLNGLTDLAIAAMCLSIAFCGTTLNGQIEQKIIVIQILTEIRDTAWSWQTHVVHVDHRLQPILPRSMAKRLRPVDFMANRAQGNIGITITYSMSVSFSKLSSKCILVEFC